jgi:putative addiction module killer protein
MELRQSSNFSQWYSKLKDLEAKRRIAQRLTRVEIGLLGDYKSVGSGVFELRIDYGQGLRLYFIRRGNEIILLLCGGDKSTQDKDIQKAKELALEEKGKENAA